MLGICIGQWLAPTRLCNIRLPLGAGGQPSWGLGSEAAFFADLDEQTLEEESERSQSPVRSLHMKRSRGSHIRQLGHRGMERERERGGGERGQRVPILFRYPSNAMAAVPFRNHVLSCVACSAAPEAPKLHFNLLS